MKIPSRVIPRRHLLKVLAAAPVLAQQLKATRPQAPSMTPVASRSRSHRHLIGVL